MMKVFKTSLKEIKQQFKVFLLQHRLVYDGEYSWTLAYPKWLKGFNLTGLLKEILKEHLLQYDVLTDKIERFAQSCCLKRVDTTTAMIIHVEISDFKRFPNAKVFTADTK